MHVQLYERQYYKNFLISHGCIASLQDSFQREKKTLSKQFGAQLRW